MPRIALVLYGLWFVLAFGTVEEPYLRTVHGAAYERYLASVGRFLPGVGRAA